MSKILVLNPFTLDGDSHSASHSYECIGDSLTVQADAKNADINYIVAQFGLTEQLPYGNAVPEYIDYSDIPNDYHAAMIYVKDTDNLFMQYPADVRSRFNNDAGLFVNFVSDPANYDEAVKLGFAVAKPSASAESNASPDSAEADGKQA